VDQNNHEENKLSHNCLSQDLSECLCLWSCVLSWFACLPCHMPSRPTRRCKETLLQVRERLTREQANRTRTRISELLDSRRRDSDSDSDEEEGVPFKEDFDSLILVRRDLYLGLLCLLLLIVLQTYWFRSTCLRN
jgi:hypothetical protein